ncbi:hypothetical protein DYB36_006861, partial [Aphanomyces astaci]
LLQLHVGFKTQQPHDAADDLCDMFQLDDLVTLYDDLASPRQLRLAAVLACGSSPQALDRLQARLDSETDMSLRVGAAIAVLRASEWMDEKAIMLLQKLLHEPPDVKAKVTCLRIVGKELPELLGNGYLVYLLHQSQESRIVHAALECCRQSQRTSPMLVPALVKWLAEASFRPQALDALVTFPPSVVWGPLVDFLEKALDRVSLDGTLGGVRCLEMGQFPPHAKAEVLLNMMDSLVELETEMTLRRVLELRQRLPLWEVLADALVGTDTSHNEGHRVDGVAAACIFMAYQLSHVRRQLADGGGRDGLLAQVLEEALDTHLRVVLKLVSATFPRGFNIHVLIEGLHSDVPEVLSAEVLETLLRSTVKHTLTPLLFPQSPKAPAALQVCTAMTDPSVDIELACLALEHYLGLATKAVDLNDVVVLSEAHALRLMQHPIAQEVVSRTFLWYVMLVLCDSTDRAKTALQHIFQAISLPSPDTGAASVAPLAFVDVRSTHMYVIATGSVQLHQKCHGALLTTLYPGACVGELALLTSKGTHPTTATAQSACVLLGISRPSFNSLMQTHTAVARGVLDALASALQWSYVVRSSSEGGGDDKAANRQWLKRLVSHVSHVDKAASAMLATIGRHRSKSEVPPTQARKEVVPQGETTEEVAPTLKQRGGRRTKSHLRECSTLLDFAVSAAVQTHDHDDDMHCARVTMTHLEKCLHLKASQFMKDMDDDQVRLLLRQSVAEMAQVVVLANGATLYEDGSAATRMYVVVQGCVVSTASDGENSHHETFEPGDSLGEWSFSRGATHMSTATALSTHLSVVLLDIPAVEFVELAEKHVKLLHLVLAWLSRKITIKMNLPQDFHLVTPQPLSPIGSPRHPHSPPRKMWSDEHAKSNDSQEWAQQNPSAKFMLARSMTRWFGTSTRLQGVVVGHIVKVTSHPQAERLNICDVAIAVGADPVQIICGAPNVREGMKVPVATVGTKLTFRVPNPEDAGGALVDKVVKIKRSKLRGEVSNGMICSEEEIGVGDDSSGIMELSSASIVGTPFLPSTWQS